MASNTRLIIVDAPPMGVPVQAWTVESEEEAAQIVGNFPAYLFKSKVIDALYLFVVVPELIFVEA